MLFLLPFEDREEEKGLVSSSLPFDFLVDLEEDDFLVFLLFLLSFEDGEGAKGLVSSSPRFDSLVDLEEYDSLVDLEDDDFLEDLESFLENERCLWELMIFKEASTKSLLLLLWKVSQERQN